MTARFSIEANEIDTAALSRSVRDPAAGAFVSFEGHVRNENNGKPVSKLIYEIFGPLALAEGTHILAEAVSRFGLKSAVAQHREGELKIGECAVFVGVTAPHRGEAFAACSFIIDAIKHRLPVWKKEFYTDGTHEWVNCQHDHQTQSKKVLTEDLLYARQIRLKEVGDEGQKRLGQARVLIVGAGGLGSTASFALAAAGVGTIGIAEFDQLEASNLHRQVLYQASDIGRPKAQCARERLSALNPTIAIVVHATKINASNVAELMSDYDVTLDCSDNFKTKYLLNDASILTRKPLVQASLYRHEGQLMMIDPAGEGGCLRCIFPEPPSQGLIGNCAEVGVLGTLPMTFGALQAQEVLKYVLQMGRPLDHELFVFDLLTSQARMIKRTRHQACKACGEDGDPKGLLVDLDEELLYRAASDPSWQELAQKFRLFDLREDEERVASPLKEAAALPYTQLQPENVKFGFDEPILLICSKGQRSLMAAKKLRAAGWKQVYSLSGGLEMVHRGHFHGRA